MLYSSASGLTCLRLGEVIYRAMQTATCSWADGRQIFRTPNQVAAWEWIQTKAQADVFLEDQTGDETEEEMEQETEDED